MFWNEHALQRHGIGEVLAMGSRAMRSSFLLGHRSRGPAGIAVEGWDALDDLLACTGKYCPSEGASDDRCAWPAQRFCGRGRQRTAGWPTDGGARGGGQAAFAGGRRGFTLLELLLALLLLVALLGAIGLAIGVQLRATDTGRSDVAQAQLARAILRQMADDLRGAIWYEPLDVSSALSGLSGAAGGLAGGGTGSGASGNESPGTSTSDTTASSAQQAVNESQLMEEAAVVTDPSMYPAEPGLYGGRDWLEVDVSRLPRTLPGVLGGGAADALSEVKTITWYLAGGSSRSGQNGVTAEGEAVQGLMRRELDRAVTQWASESGQLASLDRQAQLVAAEVVNLQFRYFDGATWVLEWDSATARGLPWAVEISITLAEAGPVLVASGSVSLNSSETTYRLVVALPLAEAALGEGDTSSGTTEDTGEEGGGTTGQTAGAGGTGSGGGGGGSGAGGFGSSTVGGRSMSGSGSGSGS